MSKKDQNKKIRYCVLICQSLKREIESASPFFELGNYSCLDYTINMLIEHDVQEIFLFYSQHKTEIEEYYQQINKLPDAKFHLHYMKPSEMKSFGDVMREVHFRNIVSDDFLVMYADTITNVHLNEMINNHYNKKMELKNVVMTTAMRQGISSQIHILNSTTNQILQIQNQTNRQFILNTQKINLKKLNISFRRDLIPVEIYICTIEVVKSFKETYQYQTMQDFIVGMLTSEVYEEKINAYQLTHTERAFRLNRAANVYAAYMNYVCGYVHPYSIYGDDQMAKFQRGQTDKQFTVGKFNKIYRKGVRIHPSSILSHNVYIGQCSIIGQNCQITKSIISKNCTIHANASLNHCIVLDGCTIMQNSRFEYSLIQKVNQTYKTYSFKPQFFEEYEKLISCELFLESPPSEQATFEEQLQTLLSDKPEEQTMLVSELVRIGKLFNKNESQLSLQMIKFLKPQGVKGIETLTVQWGNVLLKLHHDDQQTLIESLYFTCLNLEQYSKAFHVLLQFFYREDITNKESILSWYKNNKDTSQTYNKCQVFIDKLEEEESEEDDQEDD